MGANVQQTNKARQPYFLLRHNSLPFFKYSKNEKNKINELLEIRANIVFFLDSIESDPLLKDIVDGDSKELLFEQLAPKSQKKIQNFMKYVEQFDGVLKDFPQLKEAFVSQVDKLLNSDSRFYYNQQYQNTFNQLKTNLTAERAIAETAIQKLKNEYEERVGEIDWTPTEKRGFFKSCSGYHIWYAAAYCFAVSGVGTLFSPLIALGPAIVHAIDKFCTSLSISSLKSVSTEKHNKAIIAINDELLSDAQTTTEQVIFDTQKVLEEPSAKKLCAFFNSKRCNSSKPIVSNQGVTKSPDNTILGINSRTPGFS